MCYDGAPRYKDENGKLEINPGEILANPRIGGRISTGYLSSINFPIEHQKLRRTMHAMHGEDNNLELTDALAFNARSKAGLLFSFFAYVDSIIAESRHLGVALGLDDQVYRLFALILNPFNGVDETRQHRREQGSRHWTGPLDDLVDFIRANAHTNLTLTDLEERSHYTGRHLQNLFREKFDCSPMQFVRRQRLTAAMDKLQTADWDASVSSIARNCGYRFMSNFSTDFQRQFGVRPSTVLRATRRESTKAAGRPPTNLR